MIRSRFIQFVLITIVASSAHAADASSPLASHSFPFFYRAANEAGVSEIRRGVLVFGQDGARSELFPGGLVIPYQGTLTTKRVGKRGSMITGFSATGETPFRQGTVAFTASKDGDGAKGHVTIRAAGSDPFVLDFQGVRPVP